VTEPLKHAQKLILPDPACENATGIKCWVNRPRAEQLMLSGATEVRQQPPGHAPSFDGRGAPNSIATVLKIVRGYENSTRNAKR